jgi:hypothetical protein
VSIRVESLANVFEKTFNQTPPNGAASAPRVSACSGGAAIPFSRVNSF